MSCMAPRPTAQPLSRCPLSPLPSGASPRDFQKHLGQTRPNARDISAALLVFALPLQELFLTVLEFHRSLQRAALAPRTADCTGQFCWGLLPGGDHHAASHSPSEL